VSDYEPHSLAPQLGAVSTDLFREDPAAGDALAAKPGHGPDEKVDTSSLLLMGQDWDYPDSVDRCQGYTGVSVRVLMACCS